MVLQARLVIEILGRPPEHIAETLASLVERMGTEQGVTVVDKQIYEPKPVENQENLFTAFAEIEASFETTQSFFGIVFSYMPAHIELISPEKMNLQNREMSELANFILQRLHQYEAVTKRVVSERDVLARQLAHLQGKAPAPQVKVANKEVSQKPAKKKAASKKKPKKK